MDMVHTISNTSEKSPDQSESKKRSQRHPARTISRIGSDDLAVFATSPSQGSSGNPAEILAYVEPEAHSADIEDEFDDDDASDDDEEGYEYEDDDDAPFSGFIVNNPSFTATSALYITASTTEEPTGNPSVPATIRDEDEILPDPPVAEQPIAPAAASSTGNTQQKWRQPSKAAVTMSLRADQEKSGGKRRLAQDLYRIMNQDTQEAGFSLQPAQEDSMDKWTIKLFQFDEDSNLAKDMLVLGVDNIELEMSFPEQYPYEPPFVRVVKPRFKRQTGFVMNGALCMELLTKVCTPTIAICCPLQSLTSYYNCI